VRQALVEQGVPLNEAPGGIWEKLRNMPGQIEVTGAHFAVIVSEDARAAPSEKRPA
jgi:hypothetical protein